MTFFQNNWAKNQLGMACVSRKKRRKDWNHHLTVSSLEPHSVRGEEKRANVTFGKVHQEEGLKVKKIAPEKAG